MEKIRAILVHLIANFYKEGSALAFSSVGRTQWNEFVRRDILQIETPAETQEADQDVSAEAASEEVAAPEVDFRTDSFTELTPE